MINQLENELRTRVVITPATKDDLPEIERILRGTVQNPYGSGNVDEYECQTELSRITAGLDAPGKDQTIVAKTRQGEALGFAFFGNPDPRILDFTGSDAATTMELKLLYLDPTQRSKGIGSQLLDAVEREAKSQGKAKIELTSGPRYIMIGTGEFYLKNKFTRLPRRIDNYFDNHYPAIVFQKILV